MLRPAPRQAGEARRVQDPEERLQQIALELFHRTGSRPRASWPSPPRPGVTERTFFRYFPSKEAVLFQDYESRLEWFRAALAVRPADESVVDSVMVAVGSFPDDREILHQIAAMRQGVLSPETIESHLRLVQGAFARELEARHRRADGPCPRR